MSNGRVQVQAEISREILRLDKKMNELFPTKKLAVNQEMKGFGSKNISGEHRFFKSKIQKLQPKHKEKNTECNLKTYLKCWV